MTLVLGSTLVPFSLPGVDGSEHGPTEGRPTAVVMWCNHCPYVQAWEQRMIEIARDHPQLDVIAVAANDAERYPQDGFDAMRERARAHDYPFPYVHDATQEVARAYGGERTPEVFLFDESGTLRYRGAIDDSHEPGGVTRQYLRDALAALARGEAPKIESTPAVGCTIKWRA